MDDVPQIIQPRRLAGQIIRWIGSALASRWACGRISSGKIAVPGLGLERSNSTLALAKRRSREGEIDLDESFSSTGYSRTFLGLPRGPVPS